MQNLKTFFFCSKLDISIILHFCLCMSNNMMIWGSNFAWKKNIHCSSWKLLSPSSILHLTNFGRNHFKTFRFFGFSIWIIKNVLHLVLHLPRKEHILLPDHRTFHIIKDSIIKINTYHRTTKIILNRNFLCWHSNYSKPINFSVKKVLRPSSSKKKSKKKYMHKNLFAYFILY